MRSSLKKLAFLLPFCFFGQTILAQNFQKWEKDISAFEQADKAKPIKPKKYIVFTGSSSVVYWATLAQDFADKKVLNRGFGGSQTFEVVHFADRIIAPYKPKQVVLYSGENDIVSGRSPETVLEDFKTLFTKIRQVNNKATVSFISIKPSPSRKQFRPQVMKANQLIRDFLATQKRTSYIDIYTPMLGINGKPKPEFFKSDSLHMLPAGYELWAKIVKPYLK